MNSLFKFLLIALTLCFFGQAGCFAQRYGRPQVDLDPNTLKQQAFESYLAGEFESSADLYKKALELGKERYGPTSSFVADLYYELGTMSLEEGNFERAKMYLPLAVEAQPNSVMARVKMSELYMMQGRLDDAFNQIQQAQARNPGSIEAQKQLVKLMMERAKKNSECREAANLACTMESFKLNDFSKQLVKNTNKIIAAWRERIKNGDDYIPSVSVAMTARISPQPKPAMIKPPPPKPKPVPKPKPKKIKPKLKKVTPKPPPRKVVKSKPKPKPPVKKVVTRTKPKKRNGLVPPPPPVPIYTPPPAQTADTTIKIKTTAEVKDEKKKKKAKKKKPVKKKQVIPDEPDFILDWASKKSKKGK